MKLVRGFMIIVTLFLFEACTTREPEISEFHKSDVKPLRLSKTISDKNLEYYINKSKDDLETRAKWFNRSEALDLTIYVESNDDEIGNKLYTFLKEISKDKTILDRLGAGNISQKYKTIKILRYEYGSSKAQKIDAAYTNRLFSKDKLNDILRDNTKSNYQELSISINRDYIDENKFMIEGYKSVKYLDKKLNSYYYQLVKNDITSIDKKMIKNAVVAILKLCIPEYISIDRDDIKNNKALKIVYQKADGKFLATVYKMSIDNAIDKTNKKREKELKRNPEDKKSINDKYNKIIETIKASSKWVKYRSKQLLFTTPISQETINTLYEQKYIKTKYNSKNIKIQEAKDIANALNIELPDHYLTLSFLAYQHLLNQFEINIGEIKKVVDTYFIKSVNQLESDSSNDISSGMKNSAIAIANGMVGIASAIFKRKNTNQFSYVDTKYEYVEADIQSGEFYPTSKFIYGDIGIEVVYQKIFANFDKALFTIPIDTPFYINNIDTLLGEVDNEKNEVNIYSMETTKKIKSIQKKDSIVNKLKDIDKSLYLYFENKRFIPDRPIDAKCISTLELGSPNIKTKITKLSNGSYIQTYKCSPYIDLFDKNKNFVNRNSSHSGYIDKVTLVPPKYIVTEGERSSKIWDTEVLEFISSKY